MPGPETTIPDFSPRIHVGGSAIRGLPEPGLTSRGRPNLQVLVENRGNRGNGSALEHQVGHDPEVRLRSVPLGEEEVQAIGLAVFQAQAVEIHVLGVRRMHAAQVDNKPVVDEDPHVVIAAEFEDLGRTGVVGERRVQLEREVKIVFEF